MIQWFLIDYITHNDYHFSFSLCFVIPVYFFASFRLRRAWSRQPIPPYQCPDLSVPFCSCLWQKAQSFAMACSREQYPQSIVIPLIFSWTTHDSMIWQSSQLKHLPQQPYLNHLKVSFMCLHVPLFGNYVSILTWAPLIVKLYDFKPI